MPDIGSWLAELAAYCWQWLLANPATAGQWFASLARFIMPVLALLILATVLRALLRVQNPAETWAYLTSEAWGRFPLTHWECTVGRSRYCDVQVNFATVSRNQCTITRDDRGGWQVCNLSQSNPTRINGQVCADAAALSAGDVLSFGEASLSFEPITAAELAEQQQARLNASQPLPPWTQLGLLTLFQLLTAIQLMLFRADHALTIAICFGGLAMLMWLYVLSSRAAGRRGFELETLAFFSCTLCLAITASSAPGSLPKQTAAICLGLLLFLVLGFYLRDLRRAVATRYPMAALAAVLLISSLVFGVVTNGALNWIYIFGYSLQPSEIAKVCFIFAGAATLDRLYARHNLWGFMLFTGFCLVCLALMSDFGAALIFFTVFVVIAYLRSGDFATMTLILGGAAAAVGLVLSFKPYIAARFATWGHAWEFPLDAGYQQVRAMSAAAGGGLVGVGAGNGWLRQVAAADTDLVFAMVCEEWGLIIALLLVAGIVAMAVFAVRVTRAGRSAFYTTAACAAASLLVCQTSLNVLGSMDILPFTGVTFPFLSVGGSSMIASWGLLAFLKAADTRQKASFAVREKVTLPPTDANGNKKVRTASNKEVAGA